MGNSYGKGKSWSFGSGDSKRASPAPEGVSHAMVKLGNCPNI